jgi:glycosyltransferase involved in cell wall biosynthesis
VIKVVHLSSVHPPDDPRIAIKECGALADAGFDVVLICPESPNPPVPGRQMRFVPAARGRLSRMTRAVWDVYRAAAKEKAAVYHFHDAELLLIAPLLRLTGAAVFYDVHEDLPQTVGYKHWIPRPLHAVIAWAVGAVELFLTRFASGVVAATPAIARRFPPAKTVVVQNFSMINELEVASPTPYGSRQPLVGYVGAIADIRGAHEMVLAMDRVPASLNARLILAGPISEAGLLDQLRAHPGWDRVEHHGRQTRPQVAHHLDRARMGLVLFHPSGNYVEAYPVKMFEYLAVGLPIIVSNFPLWRSLFEPEECAIFVDPLDPAAIADAITWILTHPEEAEEMGKRGRIAARQRFNWQTESRKLLTFYSEYLPEPTLSAAARVTDA